MSSEFDLCIVGGGLVGATLAANLAVRPECADLRIALIDDGGASQRYSGGDFDPRVVALSLKSVQQLQAVGVWSSVLAERVCAYRSMNVWDAEGTGNIQFYSEDLHLDHLGHIVENSVLINALQNKLTGLPAIQVFNGHRLERFSRDGSQCEVFLSAGESTGISLTSSLVIGADGAHSSLREMVGIETREWDYGQSAIVTTVSTEFAHQYCCWQRFTQSGPIAFLPLQADARDSAHYCSLVWSAETALAKRLMGLDEAAFCAELGRAFEHRLGQVLSCAERYAIPLRQRHGLSYISDGVALVGDAAHTIHPLAGQGVNLGFYDVDVLANEIARACDRNVPLFESSILRRYQRQRKSHNLTAMATMEGFKRLFAAEHPFIRWVRNSGMTCINRQLLLKKQLAKIASGA